MDQQQADTPRGRRSGGREAKRAARTARSAHSVPFITRKIPYYGVLDEEGHPLRSMGVLESSTDRPERSRVMAGKVCLECGNATVIHRDGCDFCTACGYVGVCG